MDWCESCFKGHSNSQTYSVSYSPHQVTHICSLMVAPLAPRMRPNSLQKLNEHFPQHLYSVMSWHSSPHQIPHSYL